MAMHSTWIVSGVARPLAASAKTNDKGLKMASYIALSENREAVTLMLSKAEAEALSNLADHADRAFDHFGDNRNGQTKAACARALKAVDAATNRSARRAGYFDT